MPKKLTLRIDESLIRFGKRWSRRTGKSLSQAVNDYLTLMRRLEREEVAHPPITHSLVGVLKGSKVSEKDYRRHLEKKHR